MPQDILLVTGFIPEQDGGVAEFGPWNPDYRPIALRRPTENTADKAAFRLLESNAVNRALYYGYGEDGIGNIEDIQMNFPLAENFQNYPFENSHWEAYGNMEAERSRIRFMLHEHPERSFPTAFRHYVNEAVISTSPLTVWKNIRHDISQTAANIYGSIKEQMLAQKQPDATAVEQGHIDGFPNAFQSTPILYETSPRLASEEFTLWENALGQIARELQNGNTRNLATFLDMYNRIKDPITPLTSTLSKQVEIFERLFARAITILKAKELTDISGSRGRTLIAQLALESSFLALPAAKNIFYRRGNANYGGEHQELPYVYVNLKDLPRGEFTSPYAVIPRIEEIIGDLDKYGEVVTTPLTVSYYQTPGEEKPTMFLVDGNNRATALMVMDYILSTDRTYNNRLDEQVIDAYLAKHHLHTGWKREIMLTLETTQPKIDKDGKKLKGFTRDVFNNIVVNGRRLRSGVEGSVAALLVQEPNFHTVIVNKAVANRPFLPLLQPMHQSIYNHDHGIAMAIPPKDQTHGRAMGNNLRIQTERRRRLRLGSRRHRLIPTQAI